MQAATHRSHASSRDVTEMMQQLLKDQFVRIDSRATGSDAKAVSTLDVATEQTTRVLKKLANEKFEALKTDPRLLAYFH